MSNLGLNVGLKALLTAQSALDTIGHNISNANTPGYSRQALNVSASRPLLLRGLVVGNGVQTDTITRTVDELLGRRIVGQVASMKRYESTLSGMTRVESILGEPGGFGLGGLLNEVFARFSDLSSEPQSFVHRSGVTQSLSKLTAQFQELTSGLNQVFQDAEERVQFAAEEINTLAGQVATLNREIGEIETSGKAANDLRDQRDSVLTKLAEQVDITYHEGENGSVRVFIDGQLLVGSKTSNELETSLSETGELELRLRGGIVPLDVKGGQIGGLIALTQSFLPELQDQFDELAHEVILEMNRLHSTGIPTTGGFERLVGTFAVEDTDGDGVLLDQLLSHSGLKFPIQEGSLFVNVRSKATGEFSTTEITIDPERTTVGELLNRLGSIQGMSASLDSFGRIQIYSSGGQTFDFGKRINPNPDAIGSFGGTAASLGSSTRGPFEIAAGDTLNLQGAAGSFTISFDASDFEDISRASASEIAAVINAEPNTAANGMRAADVGGHLVLQTLTGGGSESFDVLGGTALDTFGWVAGTTIQGQDTSVGVQIHGNYDGDANQRLYFVPLGDGQIGSTDGLQVEVQDQRGRVLATLDVGAGYLPGTHLEVGDGLSVSFSAASVSATDHDIFALDALHDSDTSDVLVALGLNSLFDGSNAGDIAVSSRIEADPSLFAASASGAAGDNGVVLSMLELQYQDVERLGTTFGGYYGNVVGEVGFEIGSTNNSLEVEQFLVDNLNARREQTSGVNVDEELVSMIQYEQAFGAAAQYIQTVNSLNDELLSLI